MIYTFIESLCCISIINIFYVNFFQLKTAYCLQETHLWLKDTNMLIEKERKRFCKQWVTKYSRNVKKKKLDFNQKEIKWNKWEWSVFFTGSTKMNSSRSYNIIHLYVGFSSGSAVKNLPAGLIPRLGRFHVEENGNPLQYSHLGCPMNKEA